METLENGKPRWTDIMVDLETTGTLPDRNCILQIAAVKFNIETGEVCHQFFDRCLDLPKHRSWDMSTLEWWSKQKKSVLQGILSRAEPWSNVINEFADYSYQNPGLRMWSKPSHFDFNFLSSYFHDADLINPFHYRVATDLNSFLKGLHFPNEVPDIQVEFSGDAHNALQDTLWQLKHLYAHLEYHKNAIANG